MKRVIYYNDEGGVSIITPNPLCGLTVAEVAVKDVPAGVAYSVVDPSEIPEDRENWKPVI